MSETAQIAPRSPYTGVRGWETNREEGALIALAHTVPKKGVILEIGSEFGMSSAIWTKYSQAEQIYCVEINKDAPFLENLKEAGLYSGRLIWLNTDSRFIDVLTTVPPLDLLFVDGDHSYEGAYDDLKHYAPHVKAGGFLAIHDCACATNRNPHPLHNEVSTAVHHWLALPEHGKDWQFLYSVDSTMIFRKVSE